MSDFRDATPIPGPEAFRASGRDARLSQAAIVLSAGAAVGGEWGRLDAPGAVGLPTDLGRIEQRDGVSLQAAVAPLQVDVDTHVSTPRRRIPSAMGAEMTERLIDRPRAVTAAALVEVNLHSDSRLVRTSAAVAALDTADGAQRADVVATLVDGADASDALTRDLGRIGLARVNPDADAPSPTLVDILGSIDTDAARVELQRVVESGSPDLAEAARKALLTLDEIDRQD